MTVLQQRMLDDMRIRNLPAETQTSYLRQVARLVRYHGQSPELLGPAGVRTYQLHLIDDCADVGGGHSGGTAFPLPARAQAGLGGRGPTVTEARQDAAGHPEPGRGSSDSRRRGAPGAPRDPHHLLRCITWLVACYHSARQAPYDPHHLLRCGRATQRGAAAPGYRRRQQPDGPACRSGQGDSRSLRHALADVAPAVAGLGGGSSGRPGGSSREEIRAADAEGDRPMGVSPRPVTSSVTAVDTGVGTTCQR